MSYNLAMKNRRSLSSPHYLKDFGSSSKGLIRQYLECACGMRFWEMLEETGTGPDLLWSELQRHFAEVDRAAIVADGDLVRVTDGAHPRHLDLGEVTVAGQRTAFVKFKDSGDAILFDLSQLDKAPGATLVSGGSASRGRR